VSTCTKKRMWWCLVFGLLMHSRSAFAQDADDEEEEIARELGQQGTVPENQRPPQVATASGTASARGLSNTFNPAISATATLLGGGTNRKPFEGSTGEEGPGDLRSGLTLQEAEIRLSAIVDPYFRADITVGGNLEEIGFEEAYLTTLSIPWVNIRAGQMLANLGRHNLLHTHAFPFLTAPLPWRVLIGPEGLRDPGVSAEILIPLPFFTEINIQAFRGEWRPLEGSVADDPSTPANEFVPDVRRDEDLVYLGHLKTLFELGDSTTTEFGVTYAGGRNGFGNLTSIIGADLTVKWRPIDAERYVGIEWTTEYLWVDRRGAPVDVQLGGLYSQLRYQFAQRWWIQGRGALLGVPAGETGRVWRGEALIALIPGEFSALRLQYGFEKGAAGGSGPVHEVFLQAVVSIGSHPAHAY
jgi:hypothetical protein